MTRIYQHTVGAFEVYCLTDGVGQFGVEQFPTTDPDHIAALLAAAGKDVIETNFNVFLVKNGDDITLIDTGARDQFGPNAGFLLQALDEAGVTPAEVNRVFITHMHPDHCAGAVTAEGQAVFANASLILCETEHAHWSDPANFAGRGERAEHVQALAKSVFDAYAGRTILLNGAAEIAPGLTMLPLFGHTKGHCGVRVTSGPDALVIVADIVHAMDLQLADPEIGVVYDMDGAMAANARKTILEQLARDKTVCAGSHFLYPGIGRIEHSGRGYRFIA